MEALGCCIEMMECALCAWCCLSCCEGAQRQRQQQGGPYGNNNQGYNDNAYRMNGNGYPNNNPQRYPQNRPNGPTRIVNGQVVMGGPKPAYYDDYGNAYDSYGNFIGVAPKETH